VGWCSQDPQMMFLLVMVRFTGSGLEDGKGETETALPCFGGGCLLPTERPGRDFMEGVGGQGAGGGYSLAAWVHREMSFQPHRRPALAKANLASFWDKDLKPVRAEMIDSMVKSERAIWPSGSSFVEGPARQYFPSYVSGLRWA
jgi:hypothetical protein